MASEKRSPGSEQAAEAVYQQLVATGKVPPYVPFLRSFSNIERKQKQDCPLPQGIARVTSLTREAEFQSDHHRVIIWMHSEEFEYKGSERQTQVWHVSKVRVHTYVGRTDYEVISDSDLCVTFDDDGCMMYGHAPKK